MWLSPPAKLTAFRLSVTVLRDSLPLLTSIVIDSQMTLSVDDSLEMPDIGVHPLLRVNPRRVRSGLHVRGTVADDVVSAVLHEWIEESRGLLGLVHAVAVEQEDVVVDALPDGRALTGASLFDDFGVVFSG